MMRHIYEFFLALALAVCSAGVANAQNDANIPDANFKAALLADTKININGDGEISLTEAAAVDTLRIS
ncbi:MAG: hypothetical protein LBE91_21135, partial [Tannerella sp.]|nr:hypothetical protein [Tannerella sp.]